MFLDVIKRLANDFERNVNLSCLSDTYVNERYIFLPLAKEVQIICFAAIINPQDLREYFLDSVILGNK